uniref:ASABF-related peptide n=1 Tax=Suberites domuncula TaxID=55567 RepID=G8ADN4_SUBDO|nr:ASABF-related peptide [Suberites domuncula]
MNAKLCTLLFVIALIGVTTSISCKAGRVGCFASCQVQNCATGYCRGSTCVCSRCGKGTTPFNKFKIWNQLRVLVQKMVDEERA